MIAGSINELIMLKIHHTRNNLNHLGCPDAIHKLNVLDLMACFIGGTKMRSVSIAKIWGEINTMADAGPSSTTPDTPIILGEGPMTRARAKKLQRDSFNFVGHALFSSKVQLPEPTLKTYMCIGVHNEAEPP